MQGLRPFARYFEFSGRSGRAEFWQFFALCLLVSSLLGLLELRSSIEAASLGIVKVPVYSSIFSLLTIIPATAATFRRLHDRNKTGWLLVITYGLLIVSIIFLFGGLISAAAGGNGSAMPFAIALYLVFTIVAIYVFFQLALPGDDYPNDYGDPDVGQLDLGGKVRDLTSGAREFADNARATRPARQSGDQLAQIERLGELHGKGLLTDAEFQAQKSRLLAEMM